MCRIPSWFCVEFLVFSDRFLVLCCLETLGWLIRLVICNPLIDIHMFNVRRYTRTCVHTHHLSGHFSRFGYVTNLSYKSLLGFFFSVVFWWSSSSSSSFFFTRMRHEPLLAVLVLGLVSGCRLRSCFALTDVFSLLYERL